MSRGLALALVLGSLTLQAGCSTTARRGDTTHPDHLRQPLQDAPSNLLEALGKIAGELEKVGLEQRGPSVSGFLPAGGREAFAIELPPEACMTLVAIATPGVTDMDAALYTPDGELLASDSQPDSHPAIHVCGADRPRVLYYVVHSYDGAGSFVMVSFSGEPGKLDAIATRLGGRPAVASSIGEARDVTEEISDFGEGLRRRGFEDGREPWSLELATQQRLRVGLDVRAGTCYALAAFAHAGLADLNLRVFDGNGREVAADSAPTQHARVHFCARGLGAFSAEAHASEGTGKVTLAVYAAPARVALADGGMWFGKSSESVGEVEPPPHVLAKATRHAREAGYGRREGSFDDRLAVGEVREHALRIDSGRCLHIVFAPEHSLSSVELEVIRGAGERRRWQVGSADPTAPLEMCTAGAEALRLRVSARRGTGDYTLSVFSR